MLGGVIVNNLLVRHGQFIKVKGFIAEDCTDFAINLGKDPENLLLHFNPRFDLSGVTNKIFCNSRENGVWGEEQSEDLFPFQKGSDATVCLCIVHLSCIFSKVIIVMDECKEVVMALDEGIKLCYSGYIFN
uniref:Galectin n=1 Tax=Pyxicephalus adspersus TaxID=30357 RepID=A0AAV3AWS8_PYXAD|nr:TPA: hypothetical protein GDO54_000047 [Pyxicephalus adspersus]